MTSSPAPPQYPPPRPGRAPERLRGPRRGSGDRAEGVISAAIAVLIVAFLGALMWVGFQQIWANAEAQTNEQINQIGG